LVERTVSLAQPPSRPFVDARKSPAGREEKILPRSRKAPPPLPAGRARCDTTPKGVAYRMWLGDSDQHSLQAGRPMLVNR